MSVVNCVQPQIDQWTRSVSKLVKVFSPFEVRALHLMYQILCKYYNQRYNEMSELCMKDFLSKTFGMNDNLTWFGIENLYNIKTICVSAFYFIKTLAIILRGSLNEKSRLSFFAVSPNGKPIDKFCLRDIFARLTKEDTEVENTDPLNDLTNASLDLFDKNHDEQICIEDFQAAIKEQPILLNAFGNVIPDAYNAGAFNTALNFRNEKYNSTLLSEEEWSVPLPGFLNNQLKVVETGDNEAKNHSVKHKQFQVSVSEQKSRK